MGTEVAAVVDLGALTQSDLLALAAASPYAVDPRRGRRRDADFLPPPKIDRSVFNESAGSRKQTFSRHRPATNISHSPTPAAASSAAAASAPTEEDSENRLIVFHLQTLFARDDPSYPPPPPIPPRPQTLTAPAITAAVPPAPSLPPQSADPDREVINPKGTAVDLVRLAELVDPYGEELQKRTAGLASEPELLGFMNSLDGQWGSRRRRRKFVDASMFGDHLPRGWKLLLGLKRKERIAWINCRRYVSPKGHQFATCKEVSSYLMSVLGYPEAKLTDIHSNSATVHGSNAVNSADLQQQTNPIEEKQIAAPATSVTLFSHSGDSCQQKLQKDETQMGVSVKECQKCNLTFNDQGTYMQHQLSFHQRKAKRRRVSKGDELGASIDGKIEAREYQKTSNEEPDSCSHGVVDVRYQGQSATMFNGSFSGELGGKPSMVAAQCGLQPMSGYPQQEKEPSACEPVPDNHKDPRTEMTSFPELEKESAAGEPISDHHQDPVDKSGECKINAEACHNTVASLAVDAGGKLSTCNSANIHENDSSKKLEYSSKGYSQIFHRPGETYSIPKEVSLTAYGHAESKCTDDQVSGTDATQSKQVSEPCDLLHGNFGSYREENNFNNQLRSKLFSATLDERDLNSVDMEVDGASRACNAAHPPSIENEKPVEDKIMNSEMSSLKDDEIKSRIRDVNLNSCLDTISSPVSGGNYDASNTTDDATRLSIIAQCFGTSSNDENAYKDGSLANQNRSSKGENFVDQEHDTVYQPNLTMAPFPPAQINVGCFTSEIKNYDNRTEDNAKEALVNSRNMMSNETGFDAEAYNNDIFNGTITESSLAQLNHAINMKNDFASCYSLSDLNTLTGGNANDEIDIHGMRNSFVGSTSRDEPHEHSTLDFDIKGSMLEALEKSDSDLENQYSGAGPTCDSLPAAGTSGNIDDFMSMQTNFGSFTSLVRAVEDVPLSRIMDQCDLQLGFGGPKQPIYPSFEQQLRMASAGAPPYGGMSRHDSVPVPEPTLMLGYAPQLGSCPPFQLGWGPSLSKMGPGCVLQSVCVWCNSQFQHFGTVAEQQQADSLGYICPSCKGKFSGHLGINGPSL